MKCKFLSTFCIGVQHLRNKIVQAFELIVSDLRRFAQCDCKIRIRNRFACCLFPQFRFQRIRSGGHPVQGSPESAVFRNRSVELFSIDSEAAFIRVIGKREFAHGKKENRIFNRNLSQKRRKRNDLARGNRHWIFGVSPGFFRKRLKFQVRSHKLSCCSCDMECYAVNICRRIGGNQYKILFQFDPAVGVLRDTAESDVFLPCKIVNYEHK